MRTASLVLGIVGGVLAIIFAFVSFGIAAAMNVLVPSNFESYMDDFNDALEQYDDGDFDFNYDYDFNYDEDWDSAVAVANGAATYFYIAGAFGIIGGILGIIGGAIVKKKNVLAGVFMIVGCVLASLSGWGLFGGIPLLVGGILGLVKDKKAQMAAAGYPYSGYQQAPPPYNPYQQVPPQYNPYQQAPPPYNPYQQAPQAPQTPPAPPAPPQAPEASVSPETPQEPKE
jgi:hypothetical protein